MKITTLDALVISIFIAVLSISYNVITIRENHELRNMSKQYSQGFTELFNKIGPKGRKLGEYLDPQKIGIFVINRDDKDTVYACGKVLDGAIINSGHNN